ncbi:hypothetical protein MK079_04025 [Candidatus Gracilibacteria bacterium]|nr:hypothetical protein [Candidatus Gracilibacteria bacterium]
MMKAIQFLMKRPTDTTIRKGETIFGAVYIIATAYNFVYQTGGLENTFFGLSFTPEQMIFVGLAITALGLVPLLKGLFGWNFLSRGRMRIFQIVFGILLFYVAAKVAPAPHLEVDLLLILMGLISLIAGITGKAITQSGLKHGQKITKIRV